MLVTAAAVAGVRRIAVAMPPDSRGLPNPATVAAAKIAGATEVLVGNGVALIAAMAQGTASIGSCDGIFGPGPGGIAAAMVLAQSYGKRTAIGLGPTDCMIIADRLPTNGYARSFSGVTSRDMMRSLATGRLGPEAMCKLAETIEVLAEHEGLPYHARAAALRRAP